eukprot:gene24919-32474_t
MHPPIDPFVIRPLTMHDSPTMAYIHQQCFPDPWGAKAFFSYFDNSEWEGVFGFSAVKQDVSESDVVGFILGRTCYDTNDILTFAINPLFQKKVATGNLNAIALYKTFGFHIITTRRDYYVNNAPDMRDAYVMRRSSLTSSTF